MPSYAQVWPGHWMAACAALKPPSRQMRHMAVQASEHRSRCPVLPLMASATCWRWLRYVVGGVVVLGGGPPGRETPAEFCVSDVGDVTYLGVAKGE